MKLNKFLLLILSMCAFQQPCLPQEDQKILSVTEEELSGLAKDLISKINLTRTSVRPPLCSQLFSKMLSPEIILVESDKLVAHCFPFENPIFLPIYIAKNEVSSHNREEITFIIGHEIGHKIAGMLPNGLSVYQVTHQKLASDEPNTLNIVLSFLGSAFGLTIFGTGINSAKLVGNIPINSNENVTIAGLTLLSALSFALIKLGKYLFDQTHQQKVRHFTEIFCDTFAALLTKNTQAGINWLSSKNTPMQQCFECVAITPHPSLIYRISNLEKLENYLATYSYPDDIIAFAYEWARAQFPGLQ